MTPRRAREIKAFRKFFLTTPVVIYKFMHINFGANCNEATPDRDEMGCNGTRAGQLEDSREAKDGSHDMESV